MGGSIWGESIVANTAAAAPGPPAGLTVVAAAQNELYVSWQPPLRDNGAPVSTYLLEMVAGRGVGSGVAAGSGSSGKGAGGSSGSGKAGSAQAWNRVWQGPDTACSVSGLLPGRCYQFRVRACSSQGLGPWCDVAGGTTLPAEPSAPGRPAVSQRTATSLKARWTLPAYENGAPVTGYLLQYRAHGDLTFADAYAGVELATRVAGLQPGTSYDLRVAALNRVGQGPWSEIETAATALRSPPPPTGVTAEVDNGTPLSLRVAWVAAVDPGPAAAEAVGYEVEALPSTSAVSSSSSSPLRQHVGRVTSTTLVGAVAGCSYHVHLRSVGAGGSGHSPWSEPVQVTVPLTAAAADSMGAISSELATSSNADDGGPTGEWTHDGIRLPVSNNTAKSAASLDHCCLTCSVSIALCE